MKHLNEGLRYFINVMIKGKRTRNEYNLPGSRCIKLYDTYGFPVDLTEDFAAEQGFESRP